MPLNTLALKTSPTIAITGGTALPMSPTKTDFDTLEMFATGDTDFRTRRTLRLDVYEPKVQPSAPNGYTQRRMKTFLKVPKLLANTKISVSTVKTEFGFDVEVTAAEIDAAIDLQVQVLNSPEFRAAVKAGTVVW